MSEPVLAGDSRSAQNDIAFGLGTRVTPDKLNKRSVSRPSRTARKQQSCVEEPDCRQAWEQERQMLLAELAEAQSINRKREERVGQLEKALDQLLVSLSDMKLQVRDQQLLEEQLAATEATANMQQQAIAALKSQVSRKQNLSDDRPELAAQFQQSQEFVTQNEVTIAQLTQDLVTARTKIDALEEQGKEQAMVRALLQQTCGELEAERDRKNLRLERLEQEAPVMQEQILQQAQQASEYEAAVQYWRDRYTGSQRYASQLKKVLERVLPERPANLADVLTTLHLAPNGISPSVIAEQALSPSAGKPLKVDLPDFIARRRYTMSP